MQNTVRPISIGHIFKRFPWRISLTLSLVLLEAVLGLCFPLVIGIAINHLLEDSYTGLIYLALLGVTALIVGSARRFFDTRAYASIYKQVAPELCSSELKKDQPVSIVSARMSMLNELVEFFENSMPEIISAIIGLIGGLIVIYFLNQQVFFACFCVLILVGLVYVFNGSLNFNLNRGYNDELEKQVTALTSGNITRIRSHVNRLMRWNIKLSDLETVSYFFIWLGIIALFIYSPIAIIKSGTLDYGLIFSALIYVFEFIEQLVMFPVFIQQCIRLNEISSRFNRGAETVAQS